MLVAPIRWAVRSPQAWLLPGLLGLSLLGLWRGMQQSEAFRITDVRLPLNSSLRVPDAVLGQNLWRIDVQALAQALQSQQPLLKRVRVIRIPPGTLQIEALERAPVAQVRLGQWYRMDSDGVVLPPGSATPHDRLVVLRGLDKTNERLPLALRLAARLRRVPALVGHRLTAVDVSRPEQLRFVIDEDVEVWCGGEEALPDHLERLRPVLHRVARNQLAVRYIDLRFPDPVVGPQL
ncbi:MAG: FtsQ-type POTRA domain-containing protein [Candidatus Omnitrophica bacterium]|nr:FtsQ-type POTRA domain-containing protein [Candidatus Omnitrophota bacterium]